MAPGSLAPRWPSRNCRTSPPILEAGWHTTQIHKYQTYTRRFHCVYRPLIHQPRRSPDLTMSTLKRRRSVADAITEALDSLEQCTAHQGPETKLLSLRALLVRAQAMQKKSCCALRSAQICGNAATSQHPTNQTPQALIEPSDESYEVPRRAVDHVGLLIDVSRIDVSHCWVGCLVVTRAPPHRRLATKTTCPNRTTQHAPIPPKPTAVGG